jgi:hypothetical protein
MTIQRARWLHRGGSVAAMILIMSPLVLGHWGLLVMLAGAVLMSRVMRLGDRLDAHDAAVAAAKRWPLKGADARAA